MLNYSVKYFQDTVSILNVLTLFIFFLKDGDPLGQFSVTAVGEECRLTLKGSLDREIKDKHTLKVIATDGKFQSAAAVEVHVLDSNDNSPLCEQVSHALLFKKYTKLICV